MLILRSTGNNGGRMFFLEGADIETLSAKNLQEIAESMVSELPDKAQEIIQRYQNRRPLDEIITIEISGGARKFIDELTEAYLAEHGELVKSQQDEY